MGKQGGERLGEQLPGRASWLRDRSKASRLLFSRIWRVLSKIETSRSWKPGSFL
jgi:hypothetical protein